MFGPQLALRTAILWRHPAGTPGRGERRQRAAARAVRPQGDVPAKPVGRSTHRVGRPPRPLPVGRQARQHSPAAAGAAMKRRRFGRETPLSRLGGWAQTRKLLQHRPGRHRVDFGSGARGCGGLAPVARRSAGAAVSRAAGPRARVHTSPTPSDCRSRLLSERRPDPTSAEVAPISAQSEPGVPARRCMMRRLRLSVLERRYGAHLADARAKRYWPTDSISLSGWSRFTFQALHFNA